FAEYFSWIDGYWLSVIKFMGLNIIFATSLNLVNGYMGEFSCGHAGFMCVGAYVGGLISIVLFTKNKMMGAPLLPPELAQLTMKHVRLALSTRKIQTYEYVLHVDKEDHFYESRLMVSGPDEVLAIIRDITQQKTAQSRQHEAEERYRQLVEQITAITYIDSADGSQTAYYISPQIHTLLGYTTEEWMAEERIWRRLIHPDDRHWVLAEVDQCNQTGQEIAMEYRLVAKDGHVVWVRDEAVLAHDKSGKPVAWRGMMLDITARKQAELMQAAAFQISQAALTSTSLEELFPSIHDTLKALLPADNFFIGIYDSRNDLLAFPYWADVNDEKPQPAPPGKGLTEYVLWTGKSLLVSPDIFKEMIRTGEIEQIGAESVDWLGVPLKSDGGTFGVLAVQSYNPSIRYTMREREILEFISVQVAMVIQRKQAEDSLRESEQRYVLAVRGANDGLWDWNLRTDQIYFSPRWKAILGLASDGAPDTPDIWLSRIHPEDIQRVMGQLTAHMKGQTPHFECEYRALHENGSYRWVLVRGLATRDDKQQAVRMAGSMSDITARKAIEEQLSHDAMHDTLTGLPNRAYVIEQLQRCMEICHRRPNYLAALLLLDLDRFKVVNDSLGHLCGDELLIAVGERVRSCLRPGDIVGRFGGDEFAVLLEDLQNSGEVALVARRLLEALEKPFKIEGREVFTSASIGITMGNGDYERPEDIIRDADTAMNRAKAKGRARYQIYDVEMHASSISQLELETDLRRAIERQELRVYYQPIISLQTRRITSLEALVRWQHPRRGLTLPGEFMPLAEDTGLVLPIGEWVLRTALADLKVWHEAGFKDLQVAVNVSVRQLESQDLIGLVKSALKETGLTAKALQLEITESAAMHDVEQTARVLDVLGKMGIDISIDDFGTSYSSLGYLNRFPVRHLKIAQTFTRNIPDRRDDTAITHAIIALAHALKLTVIAEGVENERQLATLIPLGCEQIQGYMISRPQPADAVQQVLIESPKNLIIKDLPGRIN
ncbi:MAG TPA: EAL domain-containing protein, partial [Anaerolineaceae bacterium]|nr:EAL domain-containing protein [Anaerolineaceae bacterium]